MNKKTMTNKKDITMLNKAEFFSKLVSEINISKYDQKEFAEIVKYTFFGVFNKSDIETLQNIPINND